MTKRWITSKNDRRSERYKALHAQLRKEVSTPPEPELTKRDRKMAAHLLFRNQAGP